MIFSLKKYQKAEEIFLMLIYWKKMGRKSHVFLIFDSTKVFPCEKYHCFTLLYLYISQKARGLLVYIINKISKVIIFLQSRNDAIGKKHLVNWN